MEDHLLPRLKSICVDGASHADLHEGVPLIGDGPVQLHPDVLHLPHNPINQLLVFVLLRLLPLTQLRPHDQLLQYVVIEVVLSRQLLPLLEHLLQLKIHPKGLSVDLVQRRQEILTQVLVVLVETLQGQDARND